jgi:hypothetical protein
VTKWSRTYLKTLLQAAALVGAAHWLIGCGGADQVQVAGGGQDGTGTGPDVVVSGVVTGLGSVVVGGVRFDTTGAAITVDGVAGRTQANLQLGMVVTVTGKLNPSGVAGTANKVNYSSAVRGVIDQVTPTGLTKRLSILGQSIDVDDNTQVLAVSNTPLQAGQFVEISGYRLSSGATRATWIGANSTAVAPGKVSGIIANVTSTSLRINGLLINFGAAPIINAPSGGLRDGLFALVQLAGPAVNGQANAASVEIRTSEVGAEVNRATVEGVVCFVNPSQIFIGSQEIAVLPTTTFVGGAVTDLRNDVTIRVEGVTNAKGVLQASSIKFLAGSPNAEVIASIAAVDQANNLVTLLGSPGVVALIGSETVLSDISANNGEGSAPQPLTLAQLRPGDTLQVFGVAQTTNQIRATVLRKRTPIANPVVRGPLQSYANPVLNLLGVQVQTTAATMFINLAGQPVQQNEFFALLSATSVVGVEGTYSAGILNASRVVLLSLESIAQSPGASP